MREKAGYMYEAVPDREKSSNPLESFNHNGTVFEEQLDRMIKETHALIEEHAKNGEEYKTKMMEQLLKRYENQKINFHSN